MTTVLDRLEDLERKATAAPWEDIGEDRVGGVDVIEIAAGEAGTPEHRQVCYVQPWFDDATDKFVLTPEVRATTALIALSRNHLAALIQVARAGFVVLGSAQAVEEASVCFVPRENLGALRAALALLDKPA